MHFPGARRICFAAIFPRELFMRRAREPGAFFFVPLVKLTLQCKERSTVAFMSVSVWKINFFFFFDNTQNLAKLYLLKCKFRMLFRF
jgi:hypothetical protein